MPVDTERGEHVVDGARGELQPAVDAHQRRDGAERAALDVVDQRHMEGGQHRAGVRRQRQRPPEQGAGAVVDHRGQPRLERRTARRQHHDGQLLVIGLPGVVARGSGPSQIHRGLAAALLAGAPGGSLGRGELAVEGTLQRAQRHRRVPAPPGAKEVRHRDPGHRAVHHGDPGAMDGGDVSAEVGEGLAIGDGQDVGRRPRRAQLGVIVFERSPHGALAHAQAAGGQPDMLGRQLASLA
ncbi:hypothetical protein ACFXJ8_43405 [Nonomuraea sp. NPDC059194]|uniref:hypothetical protein n=1 Tax=Nonomuraea sp. NPDC059194 TaxID=3346764 RepID=UPI0036B09C36